MTLFPALWVLALLLSGSGTPTWVYQAAPAERRKAILYVANALPDGEGCAAQRCEWRVYWPDTGEDRLFLALPEVPQNVFWDARFERVSFLLADRIFRVAWRLGAPVEPVLSLPPELSGQIVEDIWVDATSGRRRVKTWGREGEHDFAYVWEYSSADNRWSVLAREPTQCECCGCPCTDVVNDYVHKGGAVTLREILSGMSVENHLRRVRPRAAEEVEGEHQFPSSVARRAVKVSVVMGDTPHALAPLVYVDNEKNRERVIFETDAECSPLGQIGFEERAGVLLVATEYEGRCARLVDMRTGTILRVFPRGTAQAVWVQPP